ncbi:MAG TPA: hypothetical protein VFQ61_05735, partial [Polyangiaceae bacterium]|nr:hypothetical protein [Polyangiaceae bacterium]
MPLLESEPRPELNSNLEAANASPGPEPSGPYETGTRISTADPHLTSDGERTQGIGADSNPSEAASSQKQRSAVEPKPPESHASESRGAVQSLEFSYDNFDIVPSWEMWGPYSAESASRINVVREAEPDAESVGA